MRIIHVRDVAYVGEFLVRGLRELGHAAEQRCPRESADPRVHRKLLTLPGRMADALEINSYIRRQGFDVVHFHYANSGWMGTLGGYPYFLHCHGSDVRLDLSHPLRKWLVRHSLRRATAVFFSTPDLRRYIAPLTHRTAFVPNPIDTSLFRPMAGEKHAPVRILINQALKRSKAPEIAFEAAREIKRTWRDVEIVAFAYGPELERFRACREVRFIDAVPHARMAELLNRFDIILGQFAIGSLGVSELESMACGKPVVSYVDGGLYDPWYDEPPPLLAARDASAAAEAVANLVEHESLRNELGTQARRWVVQHHDYRQVAARLVGQYLHFMGG